LDEAQTAPHPRLFPIGLVDVFMVYLGCNLNHAVFAAEVIYCLFNEEEDILKRNMYII